ncbi:MAG: hypothetical protein AB7I19_05455 [Planctomycetota bacterium]
MKTALAATLLASALLGDLAVSQNLLTNPNFDSGGLAGWGSFGNAFSQAAAAPQFVPRSNPNLVSMFGNFSGGFNVSGIFQSFPAAPGQTFTLDCWSRHFSGDALSGVGLPNDNWVVMKIAFFNAANTEIGFAEGVVLDGRSPVDVWIDNAPIMGTAPAGTTSVQALVLYLQPAFAGGAAHIDDVVFLGPPAQAAYPGSGDDLRIATGLGGATPSFGPNNDIKSTAGGVVLEVNVSSPLGTFDLLPYFLFGQPFVTNAPPIPSIPGVYLDFSRPVFVLIGPSAPPFGGPVVRPGTGSSVFFLMPPGFAGTSLMLQGVVASPLANNSVLAITDGHEIRLQ